ncbi:MAG: hypothetical protein ACP5D0_02515 [Hydrogenovibrio sp.]
MNRRWAYQWVQILSHHHRIAFLWVGSLGLLGGLGMVQSSTPLQMADIGLIGLALLLMSLMGAKLMDSVKAGLLLLGGSLAVFGLVLGLAGWLQQPMNTTSVLGWVLLLALTMSNLIHILSALLREMARGAFQHDALAEALQMNVMPIFLSNLTTALGLWVAALYDPDWTSAAWIVLLGAAVSYALMLTALPLLLLRWFLEFRVGHYQDRHGFRALADWLQQHPFQVRVLLALSVLALAFSFAYLWPRLDGLYAIGWMLLSSFAVLLVFWQDVKITFMTLGSSLVAIILVVAGFFLVQQTKMISAVVLVVPLGIVLDDAIHYFSRYLKSKRGYFNDSESCHRYALASVGKPIWATTLILMCGLLVLNFSSNILVQQAAFVALFSILLASYVTLVLWPALSLQSTKASR